MWGMIKKGIGQISFILTVLSIIIAVGSLIFLFSIHAGAEKEMLKNIKDAGASRVDLCPHIYVKKGDTKECVGAISYQDAVMLKNRCPWIKKIAPLLTDHPPRVRIGNILYPPDKAGLVISPVIGATTPEYKDIFNLRLREGRFINKTDMLYKRKVCVVGSFVYAGLGKGNMIGKKLTTLLPNAEFTVVGVLDRQMPVTTFLNEVTNRESKRDKRRFNRMEITDSKASAINCSIYIPLSVWNDYMERYEQTDSSSLPSWFPIDFKIMGQFNKSYPSSSSPLPHFIYMQVDIPEERGKRRIIKDEETERVFKNEIPYIHERLKEPIFKMRKVLREKYGEDKYFIIGDIGDLIEELEQQKEEANIYIRWVSIIALFFSAVLLCSIMFISVDKRVSEIGIRRAFGARRRDIFLQFLGEGVILYGIGEILGLLVGIFVSYFFVVNILCWKFSLSLYGLMVSMLCPFLVGLLSSLYPAMRAAKVPPAQAVRYE